MLLLTDQSFRLFEENETCGNTCDSCGLLAPLLIVVRNEHSGASICQACEAAVVHRGFVGWWDEEPEYDD